LLDVDKEQASIDKDERKEAMYQHSCQTVQISQHGVHPHTIGHKAEGHAVSVSCSSSEAASMHQQPPTRLLQD
jgi:hypothetical protein